MSAIPPIQTLRQRAEEIIARCSAGQMEAILAAVVAAKNAGTPIDPGLSSQALITIAQPIINQAASDTLAIFLREFMEVIYNAGSSTATGVFSPDTVADLREIPTSSTNRLAFVLGYFTRLDGEGRRLAWTVGGTDPDDGVTCFRPNDYNPAVGGTWNVF